MSQTSRIAKLEALLARVTSRRTAPRPHRGAGAPVAAMAPAPPMHPVPPASSAARPAPVPAPREQLPDLDLVEATSPAGTKRPSLRPSDAPAPEPVPEPPVSASRGQSDLQPDFEAETGEFEIPGRAPKPSAVPRGTPIEIAPGDDTLEIDRTPLADAVADSYHPPELSRTTPDAMTGAAVAAAGAAAGVGLGVVAGIATGVAAVSTIQGVGETIGTTRHSTRPPPAEAIETLESLQDLAPPAVDTETETASIPEHSPTLPGLSQPEVPARETTPTPVPAESTALANEVTRPIAIGAARGGPEAYTPPELPNVELSHVAPPAPRATTPFRELLARSLALRVKGGR